MMRRSLHNVLLSFAVFLILFLGVCAAEKLNEVQRGTAGQLSTQQIEDELQVGCPI